MLSVEDSTVDILRKIRFLVNTLLICIVLCKSLKATIAFVIEKTGSGNVVLQV